MMTEGSSRNNASSNKKKSKRVSSSSGSTSSSSKHSSRTKSSSLDDHLEGFPDDDNFDKFAYDFGDNSHADFSLDEWAAQRFDNASTAADSWSSHDICAGMQPQHSRAADRSVCSSASQHKKQQQPQQRTRKPQKSPSSTSSCSGLSVHSEPPLSATVSPRIKPSRSAGRPPISPQKASKPKSSTTSAAAAKDFVEDMSKSQRILALANAYKVVKQEHQAVDQQVTSHRKDLTKEVF